MEAAFLRQVVAAPWQVELVFVQVVAVKASPYNISAYSWHDLTSLSLRHNTDLGLNASFSVSRGHSLQEQCRPVVDIEPPQALEADAKTHKKEIVVFSCVLHASLLKSLSRVNDESM